MKIESEIELQKKAIRKNISKLLDGLSFESHKLKSSIIFNSLVKSREYINAGSVFIYFAFRNEVDTREIIKHSIAKKKKIALPRVCGRYIKFFYISEIEKDLVPGSFGILEPDISVCSEADIKTADLIITPGLSFDLKFNRLGYGGGYYDRVLTGAGTKSRKIALAFDLQILDNIPSCPHDCKVDMIITESNIYRNYKIENI